ncbi:LPS O-antigen length regulator [Vibrio sp. B513a]|uniref:Wzz/FepE/Etk N-terminal domain-containing protein n=1 Tax=Vibrio TaxID=662 RepID=UPI0025526C0A|nr:MULTISPECIES: Wzz/FepE/Etk N-terminal domain-containing protein [Vibrio]MDK9750031.1 LPS O-antigen length regulator [Vibrio sp. B513a]MDV5046932.1 Wzz/FepE/Etk N-terminal domain-containing protein [Vibrio diabolicus]
MEQKKEVPAHHAHYPIPPVEQDVDMRDIFEALWKGKWIILTITFLFAVSSVFYAINIPNIYKADALLSPVESSSSGGLSKMAGQLGGLAALAGVNIGSGDTSQTQLAVQVIKSRQFIESFITKHKLLVPLMAAKDWNLKSNQLVIDKDIYDEGKSLWLREPEGLRGSEPSLQEAYDVFLKEVMTISEDKDTGFYTISVKHFSPYVAKNWVNWLVRDINKVMRERTISESSQNLKYLNEQLQKTAVADMQSTFYKLIEEQTKSLMLAEVQEEFVFKVVDPAVVPELKDGPKRALICVLGTFLGAFLGGAISLISFAFRKENN